MAKWADYGISKVRYNDDHDRIIKVMVHPDKGDAIGEAKEYSREAVADAIDSHRATFVTILKDTDGKWQRGEDVRTIRVDGYSHELCGGTHCRATGQIGGFIITGERSIGSGMRRIEAVTGEAAEALAEERFRILEAAQAAAGAQTAEQLVTRIEELREKGRGARPPGGLVPSARAAAKAAELLQRGALVAYTGGFRDMEELKAWARDVRRTLGFPDRGLQERSDFTGFNWSDVPVILVELGFMSNPTEDRLLASPAYQRRAAVGLCRGTLRYLGRSISACG